jgi:AcrR family transcriptional regulator
VHTLTEHRRTHSRSTRPLGTPKPRLTQAERRHQTRQALLDAARTRIDAGESFESLSLRSIARAAGVVPTAFYRHFSSMDELGLVLVDESFRSLRAMLRQARETGLPPEHMVRRSVAVLFEHVTANRQHFAFVAGARSSGNGVLRHAIRNEIRLFTSELATDLARFPVLRDWTTEDLQMLAGLFVGVAIAAIEAILELPTTGPGGDPSPEGLAEIARVTAKQMRLPLLGVPAWRSGGRSSG